MASDNACRVVVLEAARQTRTLVRRRAHHSAETLARWKVGAEAWSKAHNGKIYAGRPVRRRTDWEPITFTCDLVPLEPSGLDGLLMGEPLPEFEAFASPVFNSPGSPVAAGPPPAGAIPGEGGAYAGFPVFVPVGPYIPGGGGGSPGAPVNGPVTPTSFPPTSPTPGPGFPRPLPPGSPAQGPPLLTATGPSEFPRPLPPELPKEGLPIVPTPEPPGLILLVTGMAAFGLSGALRWMAR